ncbi:hypothetical protein HanRHA438_Chr16g0779311 [Helianthus annuus]|nr:hypothetical protein HanRHA438_Chr16g0779311 [Helianthus annuus]
MCNLIAGTLESKIGFCGHIEIQGWVLGGKPINPIDKGTKTDIKGMFGYV